MDGGPSKIAVVPKLEPITAVYIYCTIQPSGWLRDWRQVWSADRQLFLFLTVSGLARPLAISIFNSARAGLTASYCSFIFTVPEADLTAS